MNTEVQSRMERLVSRIKHVPLSVIKEALIADQEKNKLGAVFELTRDELLERELKSIGVTVQNGYVDVTDLVNKLH